MVLQDFLSRLHGAKGHDNQYSAICPAHDDHNASLSVSTGKDGKIIMKCHAGCDLRDILNALNLTESDLFQEPMQPKVVQHDKWELIARYNYTDENGCFLFQKTRWKTAHGKTFSWSHKDQSGNWKRGRGGHEPVLYNLWEITGADTVYLVEGEKDVETLKALQLVATSPPDGAASDWQPRYTESLKGKTVYIIQDNDAPGKAFARKAANALYGVAKQVKVIDLTQDWDKLPEHGDVTDAYQLTPEDFKIKLEALTITTLEFVPSQEPEPTESICFDTFTAAELEKMELPKLSPIVEDLIPPGLLIIAAPSKIGKSWLALQLGIAVATGEPFLGHPTRKAKVLYFALEDSKRRLKKRLHDQLQGKPMPENLICSTLTQKKLEDGFLDDLEKIMKQDPEIKLVIIDTMQKIRKTSTSKDPYGRDYEDMSAIKALGDKYEVVMGLIHHTNKGTVTDPFDKISGTTGIIGTADTIIILEREDRNKDTAIMRYVSRDFYKEDTVLRFTENHTWEVVGSTDWLKEQREILDFNNNPIVRTVRKLLEKAESHEWRGTASELIEAGKREISEVIAPSAQRAGMELKRLDDQFHRHGGIIHSEIKHGNAGRIHYFFYATNGYQEKIVEEEKESFS